MAGAHSLDSDVLIAGGGLVGLAAALALAARPGEGLQVTVLEAGPARGPDIRASAITAASRRMLEQLGVWSLLDGKAQAVRRMAISDSRSEQAVRLPFLTFDGMAFEDGEAVAIVPNGELVAALRETAVAHPDIVIEEGVRVAGFEAGPAHIELLLEGGGGGKAAARRLRARLAVAADGANSRMRKSAGISCIEWEYGQWGIVTTISLARGHDGTALQHFMPPGPFAMLPLPGNLASLVWTEREEDARRLLALPDDAFAAEIEQRLGRRFGAVSIAGERGGFPLGLRLARSLVAPRLALVGDAGHRLHPLAGQGVNLGFRDCAALAESALDPDDRRP
jgi:2-octaprenyl-6-methoxyphenol hydroxylase